MSTHETDRPGFDLENQRMEQLFQQHLGDIDTLADEFEAILRGSFAGRDVLVGYVQSDEEAQQALMTSDEGGRFIYWMAQAQVAETGKDMVRAAGAEFMLTPKAGIALAALNDSDLFDEMIELARSHDVNPEDPEDTRTGLDVFMASPTAGNAIAMAADKASSIRPNDAEPSEFDRVVKLVADHEDAFMQTAAASMAVFRFTRKGFPELSAGLVRNHPEPFFKGSGAGIAVSALAQNPELRDEILDLSVAHIDDFAQTTHFDSFTSRLDKLTKIDPEIRGAVAEAVHTLKSEEE